MANDPSSIETLLGELRHRRRRQVLTFFHESNVETAHIDELVEYLGDRSSETPEPDHLAVELHHVTLPSLATAGFIGYDGETCVIRYRDEPRVRSVLNLVAEMGEEWSRGC